MNKEEKLIKFLEVATPQQVLQDMNNGRKPSEADLKLVNDIQKKTGIPINVMNVLIHYVFLNSNKKLVRPHLEKVAEHWATIKLKDVKEAMDYARREWERARDSQKIEATPVERERIKMIQSAIDIGLDDKKLGRFVRTMFSSDNTN